MSNGAEEMPVSKPARVEDLRPVTHDRRTYKVSTPVQKMTVTEVVAWCVEQGLDPSTTTFTSGHIVHEHTETDEEYARRLEHLIEAEQRHREFIKKRYHELFGPGEKP